MPVTLSEELIQVINAPGSLKVLATTNKDGVPHTVFKNTVTVDADGNLLLLEFLESSESNRNLVYSLWFSKKVSLNILAEDFSSYEIKGSPYRCLVSGPIFERYYRFVREKFPESDLAAVWIIVPEEVKNESVEVRIKEENEKHPLFCHLDRFAKI